MKKFWKRIIGGILMTVLAADLAACAGNRKEYEAQMCIMLEEKYGEEFEVVEYLGRERMTDSFKVLAASCEYPDIIFEAEAACDKSYLSDEYIVSRVCQTVEDRITQNLSSLPGYQEVKVQAISKSIDSSDADMTLQEFMNIKTQDHFVIYLHYVPQEKDAVRVYKALTNILSGMECMKGTILLYVLEERELKQVQKYLEEHANVDEEYKKMVNNSQSISIPYENGKIQMSESEFTERAGNSL